MHLFGFSKKSKKKTSGDSGRGLRKCKSTGNITVIDSCQDDSSSDSSNATMDSEHDITSRKSLDSAIVDDKANVEQEKETVSEQAPPQLTNTSNPTISVTVDQATPINQAEEPQAKDENQATGRHKHRTWSPGRGVDPYDLNTLLSLETQQRVDAQSERDKLESTTPTPRPTRLKFELPVTPSRSRSPNNQPITYPRARPYRSRSAEGRSSDDRKLSDGTSSGSGKSGGRRRRRHRRWSMLMGSDSDTDSFDEEAEKAKAKRHLEIGTYVSLIKRPLPTMGHVRYIGPVEDEPGDWIGVELEHRVGNCDGTIRGKRYFKTDPQRGIFLKRFDLEAIV